MALVGTGINYNTLLQGLSSFWTRAFADRDVLAVMYEGVEQQLGQVYLDILETALSRTLTDVPVFHKEYWKLLTLSQSQVTFDGVTYNAALSDGLTSASFLFNSLFSPTVALEQSVDFTIVSGVIKFKTDPFVINGIPRNAARADPQIALWASNALVDKKTLYDGYAWLVGLEEQPSSESYRALIKGIFQLYIMGAALKRVESALNVMAGIPVVATDGEVVTSIDLASVTTTASTYAVPSGTVRTDLQVGSVLKAFEPLSRAYVVQDWTTAPSWWASAVLPEAALPGQSLSRRTASPALVANAYGVSNTCYGDLGLYFGADEDGRAPAGRTTTLRHNLAYNVWDRALKYNAISVALPIDADTQFVTTASKVVRDSVPAHLHVLCDRVALAPLLVACSDYSVSVDDNGVVVLTPVNVAYDDTASGADTNSVTVDLPASVYTGLTAYYSLNGNALDKTNLGAGSYNGTATNISYSTGKNGQAAVFNGSTSWINCGRPSLTSSSFSMSVWIKPTSTTGRPMSFYYNGPTIGTWAGQDCSVCHAAATDFHFGFYLPSNSWTHLVVTRNGTTITGYRDGVQCAQNTNFNVSYSSPGGEFLSFGCSNGNYEFWAGSLCEAGVWSRALTLAEVGYLYNSGNGRIL